MANNIRRGGIKGLSPEVHQYEIWLADIPVLKNSHIQYGYRPVVVVSNDAANTYSPVITVVPLTSRMHKPHLPTHVYLVGQGLERAGIALCEQIMPRDRHRLRRRLGVVYKPFDRLAICHALAIQLGLQSQLDAAA